MIDYKPRATRGITWTNNSRCLLTRRKTIFLLLFPLTSEPRVHFITLQMHCLILKGNFDPPAFNIPSSVNRLCVSFERTREQPYHVFLAAKDSQDVLYTP